MRRAMILIALGLATIVAGGAAFAVGAAAVAPPTPPPLAVSGCAAGQLRATYTIVPFSGATGHVEYLLTLTNRSTTSPCAFPAPLRLTLLDRAGKPLPTHQFVPRGRSYEIALGPGQWAQALSELSPDLAGPGEPARGNCEPVARALRIGAGDVTFRAAMDPTPVCQRGALQFGRMRAIAPSPRCSPDSLRASFKRDFAPYHGLADYTLTLRDAGGRCHTDAIVGLRLLDGSGRRLPTRVRAGISSPYVFGRHAVATAVAMVRIRPAGHGHGRCDARATALAVTPSRGAGGTLTAIVRPPVRACDGGLISLSGLFRNG